ncbi:cytochrome c [Amaricoccus sp.]|uniref:c-type cytochrome n=1 Tax=Amaricoccus sp. TaxID=1872485 RepID=UPI001B5C9E74|nr:cytochrome c [Amaricoccus sp.]MBP7002523.1 cytochrome c [Amaricoccus sp.]
MQRLGLLIGAFGALALPSVAAEDPVAQRQAIMSSVGAAAGVAGGVMKNEIPYAPALGKSVIATIHAAAMTYGGYFPEGSEDPARSKAAPAIWSDRAGFDAELAKLLAATSAAAEKAGRDGPADAATFAALIKPVMEECSSCHEKFRLK